MELLSNNTTSFFVNNEDVVQFATALLKSSERASPLIMTILPVRYEDYSVIIVTEDSLDATEVQNSLDELRTISSKEQVCSCRKSDDR